MSSPSHALYIAPWISTAICLGVFLLAFLVSFPFCLRHHRRSRQRAIARRRATQTNEVRRRSSAQRVAVIDNWLISKPVIPHDDVCKFALDPTMKNDESAPAEDCSICFETFQPKDVVSWSPNPKCCKRVFHHACIKEWLLHRDGCPWCRETVLPVDGYSVPKTQRRQIHDLLIAGQQRSLPCFYCAQHKVVRPTKALVAPEAICQEIKKRQNFLYGRAQLSETCKNHDDSNSSKREDDEEMGIGYTVHDSESSDGSMNERIDAINTFEEDALEVKEHTDYDYDSASELVNEPIDVYTTFGDAASERDVHSDAEGQNLQLSTNAIGSLPLAER